MNARRGLPITNRTIAELLAREAESASYHLARAFRRAARSAFRWPREVMELIENGESLTVLAGIGPFLEKRVLAWIDKPPTVRAPLLRRDFLTLAEARALLIREPLWARKLRGDLQMHTDWSDGSGTVAEMAEAGRARNYEYIAITDHSKGLKIAGGINELALRRQGKNRASESKIGLPGLKVDRNESEPPRRGRYESGRAGHA